MPGRRTAITANPPHTPAAHHRTPPPSINGHAAMIPKTAAKTNPNDRFDPPAAAAREKSSCVLNSSHQFFLVLYARFNLRL